MDRGYDVIKFPANMLQFVSIIMLAWFPETSIPLLYLAILGVVILTFCSVAGHIDFGRHGTYPQRVTINRKASPYDRDMAKAFKLLIGELQATPKSDEIYNLMSYWSKPLGEDSP